MDTRRQHSATSTGVPRLLKVPEVAELLGVHRATVYNLIARGELKTVNIGHGKSKARIREDDYLAYVNALSSVGAA